MALFKPPNFPAEASPPEELPFELLHGELITSGILLHKDGKLNIDELVSNLEFIGFTTGYRLVERLISESARVRNELDIIKFICTDFWEALYNKQIDRLQRNQLGTYTLQDNCFKSLSKMSANKQYLEHGPKCVAFTCGLIRGALGNLGLSAVVLAEISTMPTCCFTINIERQ